MPNDPAKEERSNSARQQAERRAILLGMAHLWEVDAHGKRLEPKQKDPRQH